MEISRKYLDASLTEKCFKSCVDYPKDYLTAKQRSCVDQCASNFQKDYQKVVKSFSKKKGFFK